MLPGPIRTLALKHREVLKFLLVGGTSFLVTTALNYTLKFTVLKAKPVTALVVATIVSYILNREWSFNTRGGRERHHEAALFFLISGIGVGLNSLPYVMIIGPLIAMVFRFWAFRRWVFPVEGQRTPKQMRKKPFDTDFGQAA